MWILSIPIARASRLDDEQSSIEARVFESILNSESKVDAGKISTQAITETYNLGLPENDQATSRFICRRVAALGFQKCRVGDSGLSGFFWNADLIERLRSRYFPTVKIEGENILDTLLKTTSETPETSETSAIMETNANLTQVNAPNAEVTEDKTFMLETVRVEEKSIYAEVSEETEVSARARALVNERQLGKGVSSRLDAVKPNIKAFTSCDACKA